MLSVVGVGDKELDAMCAEAVKKGPPGCARPMACARRIDSECTPSHSTVCHVANYLFPQGRVVSGDSAALADVQKAAAAAGALKVQARMPAG